MPNSCNKNVVTFLYNAKAIFDHATVARDNAQQMLEAAEAAEVLLGNEAPAWYVTDDSGNKTVKRLEGKRRINSERDIRAIEL